MHFVFGWTVQKFTLACLLLSLAWLPANAARLALVIGNDQYQTVVKLKNARNDANLIADVLKKAGFEVSQSNDLGRDQLWRAIDNFRSRIGKGDEVVFYFAGHGVQIGSTQLLLPVDIRTQNEYQVQRDGVPLVEVQDALRDARVAVFIIDACRDNPFPKQGTRSVGTNRGLLPPEPATGQIIMLSAGRNQRALDQVPNQTERNGLFTWELARYIHLPGVEIRNALEQVKEAVDNTARRANHEQRPSLVNDLRGNFYFSPLSANVTVQNVPQAARLTQSVTQSEQDLWANIKDAGSIEALDNYLLQFPQGRYVSQAQVLLTKLRSAAVVAFLAPSPAPISNSNQVIQLNNDSQMIRIGTISSINSDYGFAVAKVNRSVLTNTLLVIDSNGDKLLAKAGRQSAEELSITIDHQPLKANLIGSAVYLK